MPSRGVRLSVRPSICLSVCPSRSCIPLKRVNMSSNFLPSGSHTILAFPQQRLWQYSGPPPLTRASNAGGVGKNRDSRPICFIACCQQCNRQVLYTQLRRIVASCWHSSLASDVLCCSRETTTKCLWQEASTLTDQNLIVRSVNTNNKRLRSRHHTVEANSTDRKRLVHLIIWHETAK